MSECLMIFYKLNFFMENKIKSLGVVLTRNKLKQVNGGVDKPCCHWAWNVISWVLCCQDKTTSDRACC